MSTRYDKPVYLVTLNVETDKGIVRRDYAVAARNAEEAIKKAGQGTLVSVFSLSYDAIIVD